MPEKATVREHALQAILDAAVDGVVLIDHRGLIQAFNRSAERLFGYTAAEVIGRNVGILMGDADQAQHDQHIARYLESGSFSASSVTSPPSVRRWRSSRSCGSD